MDDLYRAATAAAVLGSDERHAAMLQSIADVARALFRAEAATIFLLDEETSELVFAAVAGSGERSLIGNRLPANTGIAGWTLTTRQPIFVEDLAADPRFSRSSAESTSSVVGTRSAFRRPGLGDPRVETVLGRGRRLIATFVSRRPPRELS